MRALACPGAGTLLFLDVAELLLPRTQLPGGPPGRGGHRLPRHGTGTMQHQERTDSAPTACVRTRQTILETAAAVFDERGCTSATVAEILDGRASARARCASTSPQRKTSRRPSSPSSSPSHCGPGRAPCGNSSAPARSWPTGSKPSRWPRGSVALTLDQGATGLDRASALGLWIDHSTELLDGAKRRGELLARVGVTATADGCAVKLGPTSPTDACGFSHLSVRPGRGA